jgi:single-strand DNA-binding protein
MINKVILIGNLGQDPKVHTTQSNSIVTQLSVATSRRVKQADGQFADETEWHRVTCFGKTAEVARDYLAKGRQVYIEGRLRTRKWTDKDGTEKYVTEIICETLKLLGRKDDGAQAPAPAPAPARSTPASTPSYTDDDVPF